MSRTSPAKRWKQPGRSTASCRKNSASFPSEADETLEVTLATPEEAALLEIEAGAPLLLNERVLFSQNRTPVEFVKILYRGDRYRYYVRLSR